MTGTSMFGARRAFVETVRGDSSLAGVPVHYGDPGNIAEREHIWIGATASNDQDTLSMNATPRIREETYTIPVSVEVIGYPTVELNERRTETIVQSIETLIAADPTLGGNVTSLLWVAVAGIEVDTTEHADGPRTSAEITLTCKGRLQ